VIMKLSQSLLQLSYLTARIQKERVFQWHKAKFDSIKHHVIEFTDKYFEVYHHSDPVDVLWNEYKVLCKDCIAMILQMKLVEELTWNIKRLSRKKQRKYNLARRMNTEDQWRAYHNLNKEI